MFDETPPITLSPIFEDLPDAGERPDRVTLVIPVEPLAVQSVRVSKFGLYQPASVKKWKKLVAEHARQQFLWEPYSGPLEVTYAEYVFQLPKSVSKKIRARVESGDTFYMDRRGDLMDNLNKATMDALAGIIFTDDANIVRCGGLRKVYGTEPKITITFQNLEGKVNLIPK